jgi:hypothetical protein
MSQGGLLAETELKLASVAGEHFPVTLAFSLSSEVSALPNLTHFWSLSHKK